MFRFPGGKWEDIQESGKIKEALKETLLASLQMQHVIALAGCGTSLGPVNGPSMKDLWDSAVGNPPNEKIKDIAKRINYSLENQNIEEILSQAEAFLQIADDKEAKDFVTNAKEVILKKCSEFLGSAKLDAHKVFIHRLSRRRVRDPRLKVFTTNYDLCFEKAGSNLGCIVIDGFSFSWPRQYNPRHYEYDIVRRSRLADGLGNYLEGVFQLYKLHGSVNWAQVGEIIELKESPGPDEACLIYPAKRKYQQSFLPPHLESMAQYLASLREPNTCLIVVGFGFNDDHLSEPVLAAINSNPHLRLIIVNPSIIEREKNKKTCNKYWREFFRLNEVGEDILFINASFQDFAILIPDLKSLTPAEKLLKTIQGISEKNEAD